MARWPTVAQKRLDLDANHVHVGGSGLILNEETYAPFCCPMDEAGQCFWGAALVRPHSSLAYRPPEPAAIVPPPNPARNMAAKPTMH